MDDIELALDPKLKEFADWVQEEFLPAMGIEVDKVYMRMFGAHMDSIENYFPFVRDKNALKQKVENGRESQPNDRISVQTGAIKKRVLSVSIWDLKDISFLDVLTKHVGEMSHWANFAELNRDLGTLLSYNRFKQQVMNMASVYGSGGRLWKRFCEVCAIATDAYEPKRAKMDKLMVQGAKGVTMGKIAWRFFTALKQTLSLPAFFGEISPKYLAKDMGTFGVSAVKWAWENMPNFRKRILSRTAGDYRLLENEYDGMIRKADSLMKKVAKWAQKAASFGMLPNIGVDAWTIAIGAHGIYETRKAKYLRWGMDKEKAERRAIQDAELAFNKSQQSSEGAYLAPIQVDHTFYSTSAMLFRNASTSYTREAHNSARNLKRIIDGEVNVDFMAKQWLRQMQVKTYNDRFNEQIKQLAEGTLPSGHVFELGRPGGILQAAGFPDNPIELTSTRLAEKARQSNHPFPIEAVEGLVSAINKPLAVFKYGENAMNVIVGLQYQGKQFLVGVHFNQTYRGTEVSDIRGIFPKDNAEWLNWINQGKATYLNHGKIQALIDKQRINLAEVDYLDLDTVAKIIENFENPDIPEIKNDPSWSDADWAKARKVAKVELRDATIRNSVNLAMFGWILPWLWRIGSIAPLLLLSGDDDEKKKQSKDAKLQSVFAPVEGLTYGDVIGEGLSYLLPKLSDRKFYRLGRENPIFQDIKKALENIDKDFLSAVNDIFNILGGMATGINPQTITDWTVAIIDASKDPDTQKETAILVARLLSCPQSQLDKIYLEELDMTGTEASQLTPQELAERYADYKMMREAPLTGWARDKEQTDSIRSRKSKKVVDAAEERINSRVTTDKVKGLLAEYDEVTKKQTELSKLKKTDRAAYREGRIALNKEYDMRVHKRVGRYKRDMKELTERWLTTKDKDELKEITRLFISVRDKMLEDIGKYEEGE